MYIQLIQTDSLHIQQQNILITFPSRPQKIQLHAWIYTDFQSPARIS